MGMIAATIPSHPSPSFAATAPAAGEEETEKGCQGRRVYIVR